MIWRIGRIGHNVMLGLVATVMMFAASAQAANDAQNAAANKMLAGVTAEEVVSILTENKIQAQKAPLPGNDPLILGMLPTGAKFFVRLHGCGDKGVNCQIIRYGAIFTGADLPADDFNAFNSRYFFGKAYEDPKNQMFIEHAVSVAGGIRRGAVEANMFVFFQMAELWTRFLSERMSSVSASSDKPADNKSDAISNMADKLPGNSSLASFREAAKKHPEIINKVEKGKLAEWKTK